MALNFSKAKPLRFSKVIFRTDSAGIRAGRDKDTEQKDLKRNGITVKIFLRRTTRRKPKVEIGAD